MKEIFLSASVPTPGREFYETADPFLIQTAVREFMLATLGRRLIVWGGHPAVTPMVWAACEDLGVNFAQAVVLYQSRFFDEDFPVENSRFNNVHYIEAVPDDREASLLAMRRAMLGRANLAAAVFIGGMGGILDEHALFQQLHPNSQVLAVASPGGAAQALARSLDAANRPDLQDLDFTRLFHVVLGISPDEQRNINDE